MCALELEYPTIGPASDQYLLGPDLLVAPVLQPGATSRVVVVPPGRWWDLFGRRRCLEGPGTVEVPVDSDDIPVFVRSGTVIGLLPPETRSLSPYAPPLSEDRSIIVFPEPGTNAGGWLGPGRQYESTWTGDDLVLELLGPSGARWHVTIRRDDGEGIEQDLVGETVKQVFSPV